ncbi:glycosyltransferase family 4 protein [Eisenibacter elegans]|jgi:glycosyltransferase involved in cell wall biosynthesis|uniref:glycosyltransferase family 4 protein n=1 Tax=Eisenibacter elegans TaxID=997 RepID=UPI00047C81B6|nr:glycosyltransferase [Eisenibacter elegans]
MYLLWLTDNYFPNKGGMAQSCDRIVYHLRQSGVQIDVLHFSDRTEQVVHTMVQGGHNITFPVEVDLAHTLNLAWNFLQHQGQRYTQVITFGGHASLLAAPVWAAWLGCPLVTLIRGNDFDAGIFHPRKMATLERALSRSAAVACVSKDKVHKIQSLYPQVAVYHTPNGVDLDEWQLAPTDERFAHQWRQARQLEGRRVMGIFGHLKSKKGVLFLLKCLQVAARNDKFHLLIVGELEAQVAAFLQTQDKLRHTHYAFMERLALLPYYAACDLIAIPSFYDGQPNVLLEAAALGIPLLAAEVAGMQDTLTHGIHGQLFAPGDWESCRTAIQQMADCPLQQLQTMGKACQQLVQQHFTHQQETQRYLEIFHRLEQTS